MPFKKEKKKIWDAERRIKHKIWLDNYKQKTGCVLCNEKDIRCLEFHHIEPGEAISNLIGKSQERLEAEMTKCLVICANCHKKIHYNTY